MVSSGRQFPLQDHRAYRPHGQPPGGDVCWLTYLDSRSPVPLPSMASPVSACVHRQRAVASGQFLPGGGEYHRVGAARGVPRDPAAKVPIEQPNPDPVSDRPEQRRSTAEVVPPGGNCVTGLGGRREPPTASEPLEKPRASHHLHANVARWREGDVLADHRQAVPGPGEGTHTLVGSGGTTGEMLFAHERIHRYRTGAVVWDTAKARSGGTGTVITASTTGTGPLSTTACVQPILAALLRCRCSRAKAGLTDEAIEPSSPLDAAEVDLQREPVPVRGDRRRGPVVPALQPVLPASRNSWLSAKSRLTTSPCSGGFRCSPAVGRCRPVRSSLVG